jgi:hypothetical protein
MIHSQISMALAWLLLGYLLIPGAPQTSSGTVAGQIRLPDGSGAAGVRVSAMSVDETGPATNAFTVLDRITETDESGRYRLDNLPAGRYYILSGAVDAPTYYPGTDDLSSARIIAVTNGVNLQGVDFRLPRLPVESYRRDVALHPYISGVIVTDNGRRLPGFLPSLYVYVENASKTVIGADGVKIRGQGTFGATPVSKDGTFRLFLEDGEYTIALITSLGDPLTADDGWYVKSISSSGRDLLKEKLKVNRSPFQSITITLTPAR